MKREQIPDTMLMYASLYTYDVLERKTMMDYNVSYERILQYQGSSATLPNDAAQTLEQFQKKDPEQQRAYVDDK